MPLSWDEIAHTPDHVHVKSGPRPGRETLTIVLTHGTVVLSRETGSYFEFVPFELSKSPCGPDGGISDKLRGILAYYGEALRIINCLRALARVFMIWLNEADVPEMLTEPGKWLDGGPSLLKGTSGTPHRNVSQELGSGFGAPPSPKDALIKLATSDNIIRLQRRT